jgi:hypothetical protein
VTERDMAPTYTIYVLAIAINAFYEPMAFFGYLLVVVHTLLTIGHANDNQKLLLMGKIANVSMLGIGFICMFASDLKF